MSLEIINVGTSPNDGTGDPLRTAYIKCNNNFALINSRAQTNVPTTLIGSVGDAAGMYASNSNYFYYCFANYDGSSVIWAKVAQTGGISVDAITNGTSNVVAIANGNVTVSSSGTSNVAIFSNTGAFVSGFISATGNVAASNLVSSGGLGVNGNSFYGGSMTAIGNVTGGNFITAGTVTATGNVISGNISTSGVVTATGNITGGNIIASGAITSTGNIFGFSRPSAGTTSSAPILLKSGTNLTSAATGAIEYDGTTMYATISTTSGRGELGIYQEYRYSSAGSALGPAIADYFPANSSINLDANSYYEVEAMAYFLKTTANTVTWTWDCSSAASMIRSYYVGTVATGFTTSIVTGTPVTGMAIQQTSTALAHAATGSLSDAVYHHFHFKVHVVTNLATNLRLRVTSGSGTVTPQAGSFYFVRKISANAGSFAT